jgi:hypothetical protein
MPVRSLIVTLMVVAATAPLFAQQGELRAIVPVVGSTAGGHGSNFKTSLQLYNRSPREMRGTMVIRPAGAVSEADNRSLPYVLAPHQTVWFEDIVDSAGIAGLGSMDFVVEQGGVPTIVARAYNDGAAAGTTGVSVPPVAPIDAVRAGAMGVLIVPADLMRFRFNIGIRTLGEGARIMVRLYDANGTIRATPGQMSFAPHSFTQQPASQLLGGQELAANQSIAFEVLEGAAILYGTSTDNLTNDPSLQIARGSEE